MTEKRADSNYYYPIRTAINYVFSRTKEQDPLRKLLVDCYVKYANGDWFQGMYDPEFLLGISVGMATQRGFPTDVAEMLVAADYRAKDELIE